MTGAGSAWWREERRRRNDPAERTADRAALQRRLFGEPDDSEEPTDDGMRYPEWVGYGWADVPPGEA